MPRPAMMSECGTLQASLWCPITRLTNCTTTIVYIYHVTKKPNLMRELMRKVFDNETDAEKWAQEKLKYVEWTLLQA